MKLAQANNALAYGHYFHKPRLRQRYPPPPPPSRHGLEEAIGSRASSTTSSSPTTSSPFLLHQQSLSFSLGFPAESGAIGFPFGYCLSAGLPALYFWEGFLNPHLATFLGEYLFSFPIAVVALAAAALDLTAHLHNCTSSFCIPAGSSSDNNRVLHHACSWNDPSATAATTLSTAA